MTSASLNHYLSFFFFFCTPPRCSLILFLFTCSSACFSQSIPDVSPQLSGVCSYFLSFLSFDPSSVPSLLTPMQRLSFWQTCAITRTLWIIARLSIKGVISPQCPMPWQEWAPRPRSQRCPVELAPSTTCTIASSARPARRPLRGSR